MANLNEAALSDADLSGAKLSDIDFSGMDLHGARFDNTRFIRPSDGRAVDFTGANLTDSHFERATIITADLTGANLSKSQLQLLRTAGSGSPFSTDRNLAGASFVGADLRLAEFRLANLIGAGLREARLEGAKFFVTTLQGADLRKARLAGVTFDQTFLELADLRDVSFSPPSEKDWAKFKEQTLRKVPGNEKKHVIEKLHDAWTLIQQESLILKYPGTLKENRLANVLYNHQEQFSGFPSPIDLQAQRELWIEFFLDLACGGKLGSAKSAIWVAKRYREEKRGVELATRLLGLKCKQMVLLPDTIRNQLKDVAEAGVVTEQ